MKNAFSNRSADARHQAAVKRLRPLIEVVPGPVGQVCTEIARDLGGNEWSVLLQMQSVIAAALGSAIKVQVSPLHTWKRFGLRPWGIIVAPSNSNKSGTYSFIVRCLGGAESSMKDMHGVFWGAGQIGIEDANRTMEGRFKQLQARPDKTLLWNMEEGRRLIDTLGFSSAKNSSSGPGSDMRSILLEMRDGGKWAYATATEPERMLPHTHIVIFLMNQNEVMDLMLANNQDGLFSRFLVIFVPPSFEPVSVSSGSSMLELVQSWVDPPRLEPYLKALQDCAKVVPAPLQGVADPSQPSQLDEGEESFVTAREDGEDSELQQLMEQAKQACAGSTQEAVVMQAIKDAYKYSRTWVNGTMQLKAHSLYLGSTSDAKKNDPASGVGMFKTYFDKVQSELEGLFALGLLSKAGFLGKSKGTVLDIAPALHVLDHFLRFPLSQGDDEHGLRKASPPSLVGAEFVKSAVEIVQMSIEQLVVYSPEYSDLAFTPMFKHLQADVVAAGHALPVDSSGSSSCPYKVSNKEKKAFIKLLKSKWVIPELEVSVPYLTSNHSVYINAAACKDAFILVASGGQGAEGELPKLGTVEEREQGGRPAKVTFFVKEQPTSTEGFGALAVKLKAVGVPLTEYLNATTIKQLCRQHNIELAGFMDEVETPVSPRASEA